MSAVTIQSSLLSFDIESNVTLLCTIALSHKIGPNISSLTVNWDSGMNSFKSYIERLSMIEPIEDLSSIFNSILTLTQVSPTDAGVYTCNASINGSHREAKNDSVVLCLKGSVHLLNL